MRRGSKVVGLGLVVASSLASGCAELDEASVRATDGASVTEVQAALLPTESIALAVSRDTSVRLSAPNKNFGALAKLDINRGLVAVDVAALAGAVGPTDYVLSARLRMELVPDASRRVQRQLGAHRLLKGWTEPGATWLCALDANPGNSRPDCSGASAWAMLSGEGTFVAAPTATATIPASRTGTVELDVTADVRAFLDGSAQNHGWMLKTGAGLVAEVADLASRESATPPQLVLEVQRCSAELCDDGNVCTSDGCDALAECSHAPAPVGTACDDGNACTLADTCAAAVCAPGAPASEGAALCEAGQVCSAGAECVPALIAINEIESSGGSPGDWIELYNAGTSAVDLSGYRLKDNDDTHVYTIPAGTLIAAGGFLVVDEAQLGFGLGGGDSVRLYGPTGEAPLDAHTWSAHAAGTTYGRCPDGEGAFATTTVVTKGASNDCSAPPQGGSGGGGAGSGGAGGGAGSGGGGGALALVINEVESNGDPAGDWVELYNLGPEAADLSGWRFKDNDDAHAFYVFPAGTVVPAGGFLVLNESQFGFGLGGNDAARLWDASSALPVITYAWTAHATTTYGRCPDGTGELITTSGGTMGAPNNCGGGTGGSGGTGGTGGSFATWPGSDNVVTVDEVALVTSNLSGLSYEPESAAGPSILWAVQNGPSTLFRLEWDGMLWSRLTTDGWDLGKTVVYPTGLGAPDCEGVTKAAFDSPALYISTERDNSASSVSRLSILRVDSSDPGTTLTATHEWNLNSVLPVFGANLGLEAISWVPDDLLVANGFIDESTGLLYDPSGYPEHAGGVFFVGVEQNGFIYAFVLDHVGGTFQLVATIASGQAGVMGLEYDRDQDTLWSYCDDTCGNRSMLLAIDTDPTSLTFGRFRVYAAFDRPSTMPNLNNEGIAIVPETECQGGAKTFFFSDDGDTGGNSVRTDTIPCGPLF